MTSNVHTGLEKNTRLWCPAVRITFVLHSHVSELDSRCQRTFGGVDFDPWRADRILLCLHRPWKHLFGFFWRRKVRIILAQAIAQKLTRLAPPPRDTTDVVSSANFLFVLEIVLSVKTLPNSCLH